MACRGLGESTDATIATYPARRAGTERWSRPTADEVDLGRGLDLRLLGGFPRAARFSEDRRTAWPKGSPESRRPSLDEGPAAAGERGELPATTRGRSTGSRSGAPLLGGPRPRSDACRERKPGLVRAPLHRDRAFARGLAGILAAAGGLRLAERNDDFVGVQLAGVLLLARRTLRHSRRSGRFPDGRLFRHNAGRRSGGAHLFMGERFPSATRSPAQSGPAMMSPALHGFGGWRATLVASTSGLPRTAAIAVPARAALAFGRRPFHDVEIRAWPDSEWARSGPCLLAASPAMAHDRGIRASWFHAGAGRVLVRDAVPHRTRRAI
jgi:hypothetical protein